MPPLTVVPYLQPFRMNNRIDFNTNNDPSGGRYSKNITQTPIVFCSSLSFQRILAVKSRILQRVGVGNQITIIQYIYFQYMSGEKVVKNYGSSTALLSLSKTMFLMNSLHAKIGGRRWFIVCCL